MRDFECRPERSLASLVETRGYMHRTPAEDIWRLVLMAIIDGSWFDDVSEAGRENARMILDSLRWCDPSRSQFGLCNTAMVADFDGWLERALRSSRRARLRVVR